MQTEENKKIMARNIKHYMEQKGVTKQQLCEALNFKYTTFMDWFNGVTYPRIGRIEAMADYFGILKSDLIEDKSTQEKKAKTDVAVDIVFRLGDDEVFCDAVKLLYQLKREQIEAVIPVLRSLVN